MVAALAHSKLETHGLEDEFLTRNWSLSGSIPEFSGLRGPEPSQLEGPLAYDWFTKGVQHGAVLPELPSGICSVEVYSPGMSSLGMPSLSSAACSGKQTDLGTPPTLSALGISLALRTL